MTNEIWIILSCVPLYVVNSFCDKIVSTKANNKYNYAYNGFKFLLCALCMLPVLLIENASIWGFGSLLCGIACGITYAVSKTVTLKGYEKTSIAFITLCHSSSMILPCLLGHFFWSEKLNAISVIGITLTVFSIVLLKGKSGEEKSIDGKGVLLGVLIFFTSAGVMITQKCMAIYFPKQSVGAYNLCSYLVAFFILSCFVKPKQIKDSDIREKKTVALCALGSAISLSVIGFVMTTLSRAIPSVVLFPLFNGLGIIFVCIGSAFVFKEKFNAQKAIGLIIGVIGLCLVNF